MACPTVHSVKSSSGVTTSFILGRHLQININSKNTRWTRRGVRAPNYAFVVVLLWSKCICKLHKPHVFSVERRYTLNLVHKMREEQKGTDSKTPYPRTPAEISDIFSGESLK